MVFDESFSTEHIFVAVTGLSVIVKHVVRENSE